ncbi:hypothetical protein DM02DRAFT_270389 [Periconia macrospinosa]|uniref:Uncharacterized protein n=1 Tax=Periconia macrospinosa TaxID=97972 RepID=A0A2V1D503_9PLEO|nr:hypothetical protein DM02DRAFT_270389 [Periconia macrospinosa]
MIQKRCATPKVSSTYSIPKNLQIKIRKPLSHPKNLDPSHRILTPRPEPPGKIRQLKTVRRAQHTPYLTASHPLSHPLLHPSFHPSSVLRSINRSQRIPLLYSPQHASGPNPRERTRTRACSCWVFSRFGVDPADRKEGVRCANYIALIWEGAWAWAWTCVSASKA